MSAEGVASVIEVPAARAFATSRWVWWISWLVLAVTLVARVPSLKELATARLAATGVADSVDNPQLVTMVVNIGVMLAVAIALGLYLLYQSLARVLERHLVSLSLQFGSVRTGLFFWVSALATLPPAVGAAIAGVVSWRSSSWYYVWTIVAAFIAVTLFWRPFVELALGKKVLMLAYCVAFALMGVLV
ncbi:MAG: hypothetical protein CSA84_07470 [Actinomycetales bacterium]|nr:MAG: hypothetical protein CSA84_07470 [Actinomycetales bacterium]